MKGMASGWTRENGTFSVSFPRAGVGGRSSWQFLHFVRNPATSPGSMGSSCPGVGGDAAFWGGCFVPLGWRQEQPGHVGALGSFSHLCPLFGAPVGIISFISSPPLSRGILVPAFLPLSRTSVVFPLGLVWCFSEHRGVCSTQRPPCCMFSLGGGRSPVHPPNAPKCNFTGGLKGMRPENKSGHKRIQDGPVCAASWASCAFEGRDLGQDSPQKTPDEGCLG